jgi:nucleoside-diphosphate-sugar epimerase
METVGLRYFNVFGPRQDPDSQYAAVVPIFTRELLGGKSPAIFGDGEQTRDFTYIENVVSGNIIAMTSEGIGGDIFNLAAGENHSVNSLFLKLRAITGAKGAEATYAPPRKGDVLHSRADVSKARKLMGYRVLVSFEEGLRRTVEWYRNAGDGAEG